MLATINPCKSDTPHLWILKDKHGDKHYEQVLVFIDIYGIDVNAERLIFC